MRAGDEVIVVADSTKLGHQSLGHVCSLETVNYVIVDDQIPEPWRNKIQAAGVKLLVADVVD
jgi:DeoR/GlpR family transcriptional regulator of sugar metabolism